MDLMDSSYIEWLADVVMMVHRPEYYYIYQDYNGQNLHGRIEIIVEKNDLKPLGSFYLDYHEKTGVVCVRKNSESNSKSTSLKDLSTKNVSVMKLIKAFDLEEELPF